MTNEQWIERHKQWRAGWTPAQSPVDTERFSLELVGFRPAEIDRLYAYRGAIRAGVYNDEVKS